MPESEGCAYFDEISQTYSEGIKEYSEAFEEFLLRRSTEDSDASVDSIQVSRPT